MTAAPCLPHAPRLRAEGVLALFERYGVDDALALHHLQPLFYDAEARTVYHYGHAAYLRFRDKQTQKAMHGSFGVQQALVHVHVYYLRAVLNLLARYGQRLFVPPAPYEPAEAGGAGDVGALAHVDEVGVGANLQQFHAAQVGAGGAFAARARRYARHGVGYGACVRGGGAAARADDVGVAPPRVA